MSERVARENGEPEKASDKQRALIADLCRRKNVSQPDLAGLSKPKASELIGLHPGRTRARGLWP